jgi:hypothetical protein
VEPQVSKAAGIAINTGFILVFLPPLAIAGLPSINSELSSSFVFAA